MADPRIGMIRQSHGHGAILHRLNRIGMRKRWIGWRRPAITGRFIANRTCDHYDAAGGHSGFMPPEPTRTRRRAPQSSNPVTMISTDGVPCPCGQHILPRPSAVRSRPKMLSCPRGSKCEGGLQNARQFGPPENGLRATRHSAQIPISDQVPAQSEWYMPFMAVF